MDKTPKALTELPPNGVAILAECITPYDQWDNENGGVNYITEEEWDEVYVH